MFDNNKLIDFLTKTSESIKDSTITDNQLRLTGEFYIASKFKENVDNITDLCESDMIKFLFLGWYIYNVIKISKNDEKKVLEQNSYEITLDQDYD